MTHVEGHYPLERAFEVTRLVDAAQDDRPGSDVLRLRVRLTEFRRGQVHAGRRVAVENEVRRGSPAGGVDTRAGSAVRERRIAVLDDVGRRSVLELEDHARTRRRGEADVAEQ